MGCREWLSHDIFQVMNPALGNLKIVDGSCEARYEWFTRHKSTSVCLFNALARHHMSLPRARSTAASSCSRQPGCSAAFVFGVGKWFSLVKQLPDVDFLGGLPLKQTKRKRTETLVRIFTVTKHFCFSLFIQNCHFHQMENFSFPANCSGWHQEAEITAKEHSVAVAARSTNTVIPQCWTTSARGLTNPF